MSDSDDANSSQVYRKDPVCHLWKHSRVGRRLPPTVNQAKGLSLFKTDGMMPRPPAGDGNDQQLSDLQWVVVTDPRRSTDRNTMRNVRAHVMNNYLLREQLNPNSTDVRVRNPTSRRYRLRANSRQLSSESRTELRASETQTNNPCTREPLVDLVPPKLDRVYATESGLPWFDNRDIDVAMLKRNCNTFFGSQAMCKKWAPLLLSARPAFLSTVCIASAYLDMMQMDFSIPREPNSMESVRTLAVRDETVKLISQSLSDPETCSDDANIVAVFHLFCGEMIVADDQALQWHEQGIWSMVMHRGGLANLGGDGMLAAMLAIEVFQMSILRESRPRKEYLDYAKRKSAPPQPDDKAKTPESSLYCPFSIHHTASRKFSLETLEVVKLTRDLTRVVLDLENSRKLVGPAPVDLDVSALETRKRGIIQQISGLRSDPDSPDSATYEATRLYALLYATAIHHSTSFSETARGMTTNNRSGGIATLIRKQLMRTDLSNCWDGMVSILFCITLVAGAACNERSLDENKDTAMAAEKQVTRKWLVALSIRCSILLSFQHTAAVLRTLQTLLAVQNVFHDEDDKSLAFEDTTVGSSGAYRGLGMVY